MKHLALIFVIFLAINITTVATLPPQQPVERTYTEMFDSIFSDCLNQDFQD